MNRAAVHLVARIFATSVLLFIRALSFNLGVIFMATVQSINPETHSYSIEASVVS